MPGNVSPKINDLFNFDKDSIDINRNSNEITKNSEHKETNRRNFKISRHEKVEP